MQSKNAPISAYKWAIVTIAFCLFLFAGNVFSQQINFDSFKRDDVNAFDRLIINPYSKPLDYAGTQNGNRDEVIQILIP